jgi:Kdo2-lipid IVA lauroyltransferase/acyltransferase
MRSSLYTLGAFRLALLGARWTPRWFGQVVARVIARFAAPASSQGFAEIRENLRIVTGLQGAPLDRLSARNISNFAAMLADYFYFSCREGSQATRLLAGWSGWEHLEQARAAGRGIVLVTGHLGHWELGGLVLTLRGLPITVVTLEEPSTELTTLRDDYRRRLGIKTVYVGPGREFAFLEMIKLLRRNECVAMLVDRPYPGTGSPVEFFGHTAEFSTAPALLWQHTGAAVIPAFVTREASGQYISFAEPPVAMEPLPDKRAALRANTQRVATAFETIIRRFPDQWFNYAPVFLPPSPPAVSAPPVYAESPVQV